MSPENLPPNSPRYVDELGIPDYEVYPEDSESSNITDPSDLEFIQGFLKSQATKLIGASRDYEDDNGIDSKGPKNGLIKHLNKAKRSLDNLSVLQQKLNMSPQPQSQPPQYVPQMPPQTMTQPPPQQPYYPPQPQYGSIVPPMQPQVMQPQADGAVWFQLIYTEIQKFTVATNNTIGGLQNVIAQQNEVINALTEELKKLRRSEKKTTPNL